MKVKFTLLASLSFVLLLFCTTTASAQAVGDYESNGTGGGNWTTVATWQTWSGTAWVPAVTTPDATSGVITILGSDIVILSSNLTIDQVVVNSGGLLRMGGGRVTITLNNNPVSSALDVKSGGAATIEAGGLLTGTGTLLNEAGGNYTVTGSSTLGVNTTNNGTITFSNTSGFQTNTLTNNNIISWTDNNLYLINGGTILNASGGNMNISVAGTGVNFLTTGAPNSGTFTNASGATVYTSNATLGLTVTPSLAFTNNGTIKGVGTVDIQGGVASTGTIAPGNGAAAVYTMGQTFAGVGTPTYNIGLYTAGDVAGTNYSQMAFVPGGAAAAPISLSSSTLTVTDGVGNADPVNTVYTLFTASGGTTFNTATTFATTNLPPALGTLTVNATSITVKRIATLPLTWGPFTATAAGSKVLLSWTTLQESNTADFIVERSSDGTTFSPIGTVKAAGNSSAPSSYSFTDATPSLQGFNYYRLTETDLDGKKNYSVIDVVSFGKTSAIAIQTSPNPVRDLLNITVQEDNITLILSDMNGVSLKTLRLARGFQQASVSDLPAGVYQINVYKGSSKIDSRQIIKL